MRAIQAVSLAGRIGPSLHPFTYTVLNPMKPINGNPFLDYIMQDLKKNGITEIVILVGYLSKHIVKDFGDGSTFDLKIQYSYSTVESDTGTRIKNALPLLKKEFLLLYGDNFWPLDLHAYVSFYRKKNKMASIVIYENKDNYSVNKMFVDAEGMVTAYDKTGRAKNLNGVDIGYFILHKDALNELPKENFSFEEVIVKKLIQNKQLAGFLTPHKYYGLSTPQRLPLIKKFFKKRDEL